MNVEVYATADTETKSKVRKSKLDQVQEPALIGTGQINLALKVSKNIIDILPTRKPKIPRIVKTDLHSIPQWRRPSDYKSLKETESKKEKTEEPEGEVDLDKLAEETQNKKIAELNDSLDYTFVDFSAKLVISINTNPNGSTARSKLDRTENSIIKTKEQAKQEEEQQKIEEAKEIAKQEAVRKYRDFIKKEYMCMIDNKRQIAKIKADDQRNQKYYEEEEDYYSVHYEEEEVREPPPPPPRKQSSSSRSSNKK